MRIREVATQLFYERGYHATSMREIAAGVGIKAGSMYNHFPGKQDILFQICHDSARQLRDGAKERLAAVTGVEERLRTFIRWHVEFHAINRHSARVADDQLHALSPANRRKVVKVRDGYEELLEGLLREGEKAKLWKLEDRRVVAFGIATMCTGVDLWFRPDGPLSAERIGEIYSDFVLSGLRGQS